jgi:GxxExxY protein
MQTIQKQLFKFHPHLHDDNLILEFFDNFVDACIEVHTVLGPGLAQAIYEEALSLELQTRKIKFQWNVPFHMKYKSKSLCLIAHSKLIVANLIHVEFVSTSEISKLQEDRLRKNLIWSNKTIGLLVNLNEHVRTEELTFVCVTKKDLG